jgi:DNA-binding transcriptional ArsR family regulator
LTSTAVDLDRTLAALADPERRRTVDLLRGGPRRAGELAAAMSLRPPAMSRHLRVLRESGLVEESHPSFDARVRIYRLRPEPMAELKAWLELAEELWTPFRASMPLDMASLSTSSCAGTLSGGRRYCRLTSPSLQADETLAGSQADGFGAAGGAELGVRR